MKYLIAFFALCFAVSAQAAEPVAFKAVPGESSIVFEALQGTATVSGQFPAFTARILFHPEALDKSKVEVVIDTSSVTSPDRQAVLMLSKDEWLATKIFPQARFVSSSFKSLGDNRYEALGVLSIKDRDVPVTLTFTLNSFSAQEASITGEAIVNRKDYHIGWDDTKSVANAVKVKIAVKAVAQ